MVFPIVLSDFSIELIVIVFSSAEVEEHEIVLMFDFNEGRDLGEGEITSSMEFLYSFSKPSAGKAMATTLSVT